MILVDTCILSLAFRRKRHLLNGFELSVCDLLEAAVAQWQVELLGMVRLETLTGIRERSQYERVKRALRSFTDVALSLGDYEEAAEMSNKCRTAGVAGSAVDFLICAVAVRRDWQILTIDGDFELYRKHLPLELVTPKGRRLPRPN